MLAAFDDHVCICALNNAETRDIVFSITFVAPPRIILVSKNEHLINPGYIS
jgi:hypothetical protein